MLCYKPTVEARAAMLPLQVWLFYLLRDNAYNEILRSDIAKQVVIQ